MVLIHSPTISVIVPCYNAEKTIRETVGSVIAQTYTSYEIILIDDGSKDETINILNELKSSCSHQIRVIQQDNSGVSCARNNGVRESKGKFITFLDSDDLFSTDKLEKQVEAIVKSGVDAVFSTLERFEDTPDGRVFFNLTQPPEYSIDGYPITVLEMDLFSYANFSTGLFKKEVFESLKWNMERKTGEDWELWLEFSTVGFKAKEINVTTNYYRKHDNNSTKLYDTYMTMDAHLSILSKQKIDAKRVNQVAKRKVLYYSQLVSYEGHRLGVIWMYLNVFFCYPHAASFASVKIILKNILLPQYLRQKISVIKKLIKK
ncbi:MAG: glycosyltransferase family 2 protein [Pseudomonadales bacterium]|nr:glycosyltransferase family 2 protein [Pseudomonadales bacterium]